MTAEDFWSWFKENNSKYLFLNVVDENEKERLLDEFLENLHMFSSKLFFEIGGHPDGEQEVIITAEGKVEYFDKVEELINKAPVIKDWVFTAFKPPMPEYKIEYKGIKFEPDDLWFLPLESKANPEGLGLRIGLREFDDSKRQDFLFGAYLILDNMLGEKAAALDLQHVQVGQLPIDPEQEGYIKLPELPEYIRWRKKSQK